jgi:hypothetical protein
MGGIADEDVEWAIVNRLKAMLDAPPKTKFNVTQTFALFSSILLWSKNRAWVAGSHGQRRDWEDPTDHQAHDARETLRGKMILDAPWRLSRVAPRIILVDRAEDSPPQDQAINSDFENMTAESFFEWLRNALAHGDGRTIRPIHKRSLRTGKTLLAGFRIEFAEQKRSPKNLQLSLFHDDMRRIGAILADLFCQALSGGDRYVNIDEATRVDEQAA